MKLGMILIVVLGLLAAGAAAFLVQGLSTPRRLATAQSGGTEADVLVATRDLPAMTVVESEMVEVRKVPRDAAPAKALANPVQAVGKVLIVRVLKGASFTESNFARDGSLVHLTAALPSGKRAVTVSLNDYSGMMGLLYAGSVVDVMVSVQADGRSGAGGEMITRTLLQRVQVLAVGSQTVTSEAPEKEPSKGAQSVGVTRGDQRLVTLLVDQKEAQALQLAMQRGTLSVSMRNPMDRQDDSPPPTRVADLAGRMKAGLSEALASTTFRDALARWAAATQARAAAEAQTPVAPSAKPVAPAPAPGWEALIIRGTTSEVRTFPMPEKKAAADTGGAGGADGTAIAAKAGR